MTLRPEQMAVFAGRSEIRHAPEKLSEICCPLTRPDLPDPAVRTRSREILRHRDGELERIADTLAVEEELSLAVVGGPVIGTVRTPGNDRDLVLGMLLTNGIISGKEDVEGIELAAMAGTTLAEVRLKGRKTRKRGFGRLSLESAGPCSVAMLYSMRRVLENFQELFHITGATHSAVLFDAGGGLLAMGEDVGRHNAFDKAIGQALRRGLLPECRFAVLSSRLARELVLKAVMARIPVLAGFSVATSAAVACACEHGLTLVGRLRDRMMNIYANPERITDA